MHRRLAQVTLNIVNFRHKLSDNFYCITAGSCMGFKFCTSCIPESIRGIGARWVTSILRHKSQLNHLPAQGHTSKRANLAHDPEILLQKCKKVSASSNKQKFVKENHFQSSFE